MKFLDVKTDYAFKKVFGSEGAKDILLSFLNVSLRTEGNPIMAATKLPLGDIRQTLNG